MMEMKQCARCGEQKPLEAFAKNRSMKDGLHYYCRECIAAYSKARYAANRDREREKNRINYEARKDANRAKALEHYRANKEQHAARMREWQKANPHRVAAYTRARKAGLGQATPMWLSKEQHEAMAAIYAEAAMLAAQTGVPHHVDHIVPLKGRKVCGLHVPWNLRAIPASENQSKSNKLMEHV